MDKQMKIAIIDSGVFHGHKEFVNEEIHEVMPDGSSAQEPARNGHGTAIYQIIRTECDKNCEIINIRTFQNDEIEVQALIQAIELAIALDVKIINLSLGLTVCYDIPGLRSICNKAYEKNIILISAFSNDGSMSFPAAFKEVIGVTTDISIKKNDEYFYYEDSIVNVAARGGIQRLAWNGPEYMFLGGNSFACAHLTATVSKMITYSTTIEDVFRLLSKHAAKNKTIIHECEKRTLSKIKRASVFPFSKEIQGILAHQNLLDFELDAVYDTKYSGRVGANVSQFMPYAQISPDHVIKNVKDFTCTDIDTMIIGHWEAMKSKLKSEDILRDLINQCIKNKVHIYSFDDLSRYSFPDNCIYTPKVTKKDVPPKRMGKLFQYNKPILGIFGTSSKQGKFTLQLQLRQELIKAGYRIGQMGTEPTSELFGFDCTFPMGYHSTVEIQNEETVEYLNMQMQNICEKEPDIILVGCQSGSTIYDYGNLSSYLFQQHAFLVATQPDAVILCVNYFDEDDYIKRTVQFIESASPSKVIAIVIFPLTTEQLFAGIYKKRTQITQQQFLQRKKEIENTLGISVFLLRNTAEKILDHVINYFSEDE